MGPSLLLQPQPIPGIFPHLFSQNRVKQTPARQITQGTKVMLQNNLRHRNCLVISLIFEGY